MIERTRDEGSERRRRDGVPDAPNVLLLSPSRSAAEAETCADLLACDPAAGAAALRVEFGHTPVYDTWEWPSGVDESPASFKIISIGQRTGPGDDPDRFPSTDVSVERIEGPAGLDEVGVRIAETLLGWCETYGHVSLCLDSLSSLQRRVGLDATYHFLHVLSTHVSRLGVRAHYHLDPGKHAIETTYTYETLTGGIVATRGVEIAPSY